ncbi:replication factor A protein 3-domain-containing protein [Irpex rosettiformis]|uniref:Replication factor A protein 3-domain-containing protein n=1 Tax=Irpex rosettiformis TaxID=378272 RepID=A0ACB8U820_9APHY|nr:replication factor A protein 3-domain-containing protein [Irpex rosettiformis]
MSAQTSPRVNSARLSDYRNRTVRLTGKVLRFTDSDDVILQASDGGEVKVVMIPGSASALSSTYVEVIGVVQSADTIKAQACINNGDDLGNYFNIPVLPNEISNLPLDLDVIDFVVEKWHDPKFASLFA